MIRRLALVILAVAVLSAAAAELLLPEVVSKTVAQGMSNLLGSSETMVKVEKRPAILMLGGEFDSIHLSATNANVDKISFSEMQADLKNVQLDMSELLNHKAVRLKSVGEINLTAAVTQEELARFLNQNVKGIKNAKVTIDNGKVQVSSAFALGPIATIAITLEGKIVEDGQKIKFATERFLLNNTVVGNIGGVALTEIPLLDLKKLPFGVTVRDVVMEKGKVVVYADNRGRQ
jgi:hypothetical protein